MNGVMTGSLQSLAGQLVKHWRSGNCQVYMNISMDSLVGYGRHQSRFTSESDEIFWSFDVGGEGWRKFTCSVLARGGITDKSESEGTQRTINEMRDEDFAEFITEGEGSRAEKYKLNVIASIQRLKSAINFLRGVVQNKNRRGRPPTCNQPINSSVKTNEEEKSMGCLGSVTLLIVTELQNSLCPQDGVAHYALLGPDWTYRLHRSSFGRCSLEEEFQL